MAGKVGFWRYYVLGFPSLVRAGYGWSNFWIGTVAAVVIGLPISSWLVVPFAVIWIASALLRGSWEENQTLSARVEELQSERPQITVEPVSGNSMFALLVRNSGGRASFRARFRVLDCSVSPNRLGGHVAAWNDGSETADIFRGGEQPLVVGHTSLWAGSTLHWRVVHLSSGTVRALIEYNHVQQPGGNAAPWADLEYTVTADPPMPEGPWVGQFRFTQSDLVKLPRVQ